MAGGAGNDTVNETLGGIVAAMAKEANDRSDQGDNDYMDDRMLNGGGGTGSS